MKNILKYMLFLIIINFAIIFNVNALNPYNQTGPYGTNCTWYAWKMTYEKAGVSLPSWGDAKEWYNQAKNAGYKVGTSPKANSIIVWGNWTSYGHVGYVEEVEGNVINVWDSTGPCIDEEDEEFKECIANGVSEETDKICYANAKKIACQYTISPDVYGITGYIYLDYIPQTTTPSKPENDNSISKEEDISTNIIVSKSNNANLSDIDISTGNIDFDKDIFEYDIEVENEVDKITINAEVEDEKAIVGGTGDYELDVGLNKIKLMVTAEDGSTKEYIIQVIRKEKVVIEQESNANNIQPEEEINNKQPSFLILNISFAVIFIIVILFCYKKKK